MFPFLSSVLLRSRIDIHGRKLHSTWTLLSKTVLIGETTLHLKHAPTEMGWQVGDRTVGWLDKRTESKA